MVFEKCPENPGTFWLFGTIYGRCFFINNDSYALFPLELILNEHYKYLSSNSKILYTLFLNRLNLSKKNLSRFCDSGGLFIYYTNAQICRDLCCSINPVIHSLNELEKVGLIKRKYQAGKPIKIYVNDVFGMHGKLNIQEKANTYKPKQKVNPHSPAPQKDVSFDVERAKESAKKHRESFAQKKKRRTDNPTF
ncbi:MAG: replication initiator protein A [Clostridia bacterium]|nr:replication initiator protein A [Clostridia bacterium]